MLCVQECAVTRSNERQEEASASLVDNCLAPARLFLVLRHLAPRHVSLHTDVVGSGVVGCPILLTDVWPLCRSVVFTGEAPTIRRSNWWSSPRVRAMRLPGTVMNQILYNLTGLASVCFVLRSLNRLRRPWNPIAAFDDLISAVSTPLDKQLSRNAQQYAQEETQRETE